MSKHKPQHKAPSNKIKYVAVLAAIALLFFCAFIELQGFSRYSDYAAANTQHPIERTGSDPANPIYGADEYFYMPTPEIVEYLDNEGFIWDKKEKCFKNETTEDDRYIQFSSSPIFGRGTIQSKESLGRDLIDQGVYGVNIVVEEDDPSLGNDLCTLIDDDDATITSRYEDPSQPQWCLCGILYREDVDYAFFIYQRLLGDGRTRVAFSICSQIHFKDAFHKSIDESKCATKVYDVVTKNLES